MTASYGDLTRYRRPPAGYAAALTVPAMPVVRPVPPPAAEPGPAPTDIPPVRRTVVDRLLAVLLGDERPGTHRRTRNAGRHRPTSTTTGDTR